MSHAITRKTPATANYRASQKPAPTSPALPLRPAGSGVASMAPKLLFYPPAAPAKPLPSRGPGGRFLRAGGTVDTAPEGAGSTPAEASGPRQIGSVDLADLTVEALAGLDALRYHLGYAESSLTGPTPLEAGEHLARARDRAHQVEEALLDVGAPLAGLPPAAGAAAITRALTEGVDPGGRLKRDAARWKARRPATEPSRPADSGLSPRQHITALREEILRLREQHAAREAELERQLAAARERPVKHETVTLERVVGSLSKLSLVYGDGRLALAAVELQTAEDLEDMRLCGWTAARALIKGLKKQLDRLDTTGQGAARLAHRAVILARYAKGLHKLARCLQHAAENQMAADAKAVTP